MWEKKRWTDERVKKKQHKDRNGWEKEMNEKKKK